MTGVLRAGHLDSWPARNTPVSPVDSGKSPLLLLFYLPFPKSLSLFRSVSPAAENTLDVFYYTDILYGRPEMLDVWIVAFVRPGPDQDPPPPGQRLRVFPTILLDVYWAMRDEREDPAFSAGGGRAVIQESQ